jgi:hypothetical protein
MEVKMNTNSDYTMPVSIVNLFLISTVLVAIDGIDRKYSIVDATYPLQIIAGVVGVHFFYSCVVTSILYLCSRNRDEFRVKRCLILTVWVFVLFESYAVARADDKTDFVQSFYQNCNQSQKKMLSNVVLPDKFIENYCSCAASSMFDKLTQNDINQLAILSSKKLQPTVDFQAKLKDSADSCMKSQISKMSKAELAKMDKIILGNKK